MVLSCIMIYIYWNLEKMALPILECKKWESLLNIMDLIIWNRRTLNANQIEIMLRHYGISNLNVFEFQFQYIYIHVYIWMVGCSKIYANPKTSMIILCVVFCLMKPVIFVMEMQNERIFLISQRAKMAMVRKNTHRKPQGKGSVSWLQTILCQQCLLSISCVSHSAFP